MRNLIAALIAAVITASIGTLPAKAGVPCSVPFTLTNGTTADANQVMANYNAILTCLSTSAAANGVNADITALNALTGPLTVAQAPGTGLPGATVLVITNSGTTALTVNAAQAVVANASGLLQYGAGISLTLALNTTGVNGLDTGALAASTTYYLYLIGNGSTIASLASLSPSAPTLPGGYTYSVRIGAWYSNTLSQLTTGRIAGRQFSLQQRATTNLVAGSFQETGNIIGSCNNGPVATDTMALTTFTALPPTAIAASIMLTSNGSSAAVANYGPSTRTEQESIVASTGPYSIRAEVVIAASQQVWACSGGTSHFMTVVAWIDSVNAN
jgi:hypothetical protein